MSFIPGSVAGEVIVARNDQAAAAAGWTTSTITATQGAEDD
jgi:hypothetical protein